MSITRYITVKRFAELVAMHPDTVRRLCVAGDIRSVQRAPNSPYKIPSTEVARFMEGAA